MGGSKMNIIRGDSKLNIKALKGIARFFFGQILKTEKGEQKDKGII